MKAPGAILALDLATVCGFALLRADGRIESGEVSFALKKDDGQGRRYVKFRAWLLEVKQAHPDLAEIVYEQVMGHGAHNIIAGHVYGGLLATLQAFGEHHGIAYRGIGVSTIKKRFAGHGKASKADVIAQCRALGFKPGGDNEADAIALLHVALDRCPILTPCGASPKKRQPKRPPATPEGANPF